MSKETKSLESGTSAIYKNLLTPEQLADRINESTLPASENHKVNLLYELSTASIRANTSAGDLLLKLIALVQDFLPGNNYRNDVTDSAICKAIFETGKSDQLWAQIMSNDNQHPEEAFKNIFLKLKDEAQKYLETDSKSRSVNFPDKDWTPERAAKQIYFSDIVLDRIQEIILEKENKAVIDNKDDKQNDVSVKKLNL